MNFGCLGHKTPPNAQNLLRGDRGDVIVAICQCMNDADIEGRKALLGALQQSSS
jgi:BioD-like phosphotransacetylase family protein